MPKDSASHRQDEAPKPPPSEPLSKAIVSTSDPVRLALAEALTKATAEGRWDAVVAIAEALRAGG